MELVIFAGPNGSGKSTIVSQFLSENSQNGFESINPDNYAKIITEDISVKEKYERAFALAEKKRGELVEKGKNICLETVNSTDRKFPFYNECKQKGYRIRVFFIATNSSEINVRRVAIRKEQGGHDVPTEKIKSRYEKSMRNLLSLVGIADELQIYDNSIDGSSPRLIFFKDENYCKVLEKTEWLDEYLLKPLNLLK